MAVRWRRNPAGVKELISGPGAQRVVTDAASNIARNAAGLVHRRSGRAAASYKHTEAKVTARGAKATAYTDHEAGHIIEFGSEDTEPQRPLTRGAIRAGLRLRGQQ